MNTTGRGAGDMTERCDRCGRDTPHAVAIEIRTESDQPRNRGYSREPYRVSTCRACGEETALRMNNE